MTALVGMNSIDHGLIAAWLATRSIARDLPQPVPDRGGLRVDTRSDKEVQRWVFTTMVQGLSEIAREISAPGHLLKLCGNGEDLIGAVPARWQLQPASYVMIAGATSPGAPTLPEGYRLECNTRAKTHVGIVAPDGSLAASGYAAETADVFIYDRIKTAPEHRRRGLGAAVMIALGAARRSRSAQQILVATEDGRKLYTRLGWSIYSPYATAMIPAEE